MMRDMDAINKERLKAEGKDESEDDQKIRKENEKEIEGLWKKKEEGAVAFLKHCVEKYKNWKNEKVNIDDDDLKFMKIKATLVKTIFHYHPDRQNQDREGVYTSKDVFIRKEITTIMNTLNNEIKLGE